MDHRSPERGPVHHALPRHSVTIGSSSAGNTAHAAQMETAPPVREQQTQPASEPGRSRPARLVQPAGIPAAAASSARNGPGRCHYLTPSAQREAPTAAGHRAGPPVRRSAGQPVRRAAERQPLNVRIISYRGEMPPLIALLRWRSPHPHTPDTVHSPTLPSLSTVRLSRHCPQSDSPGTVHSPTPLSLSTV